MKILLIYHFFHPDTVISARLFGDLAEHLAASGHQVTVYTGNRLMHGSERLAATDFWQRIKICRFNRPNFNQGRNIGRLLKSIILQNKFLFALLRNRRDFDVVIVGTDPQFSYLMFPWIKLFSRRLTIIHWAYDLYPEALTATGKPFLKLVAALLRPWAKLAYRNCDIIADLGGKMRELLAAYRHRADTITLTPWALNEPDTVPLPDAETRRQLFKDAKLTLLYSGTSGHAHDLHPFIALARECRKRQLPIGFCFAGYGNCYQEQCAELTAEDTNVQLAGFVSEAELPQRLGAPDIHLISLRPGWEGVVVPSKFFGALAIGRPVLYSGRPDSDIGRIITEEKVGWIMSPDRLDDILAQLTALLEHPELIASARNNAFAAYHRNYAKSVILRRWDELLNGLGAQKS